MPDVAGAANLGKAQGKIVIETKDLERVRGLSRQVGAEVERNLGKINTGAKQAQSGMTGLTGSLDGLIKGYGALAVVTTAFDWASLAATNDRTRESFDRLAAGVGSSGDDMLASMQKTSRGAIADSQLILNANRAILLGAADTQAELNKLLEVARVRGQAVGLSTGEAFTRLTQGIGKLEIEILDELGLAVKLIPTYQAFADSIGKTVDQLTEAEKRQALFNQIVRQSQGLLDASAGSADDAAGSFERFATSLENAKNSFGEFLLAAGTTSVLDGLSAGINQISDDVKGYAHELEMVGKIFSAIGAGDMRRYLAASKAYGDFWLGKTPMQDRYIKTDLAPNFRAAPSTGPVTRTETQTTLIQEWAQGVRDIERSANTDRLAATRQFESQRAETIRSYEQGIARDAQDFAISRARQAAQLADMIADIGSERTKRETAWATELNERLASIRAEGGERIADIEREYAKNRERAERDHRDNLFSAAGRLDAVAVAAEQRRFGRAQSDAEEDFKERVTSERESLQERIDQENAAHAERLADAREADAERIQDAKDALAESQRIEDEDRALRLQRQAEDHQAQLAQMAVAQAERLAQIAQHAADERAQLDEEAKAALAKEGLVNQEFMARQTELKRQSLLLFENWWKTINKAFEDSLLGPKTKAEAAAGAAIQAARPFFPGFANGGPVMRTGLANVHAGEYVLSKSMLANMAGAGYPPGAGMMGAGTQRVPGNRTSTLTLGEGAIQIFPTPNQSAGDIAGAVRAELTNLFEELAG